MSTGGDALPQVGLRNLDPDSMHLVLGYLPATDVAQVGAVSRWEVGCSCRRGAVLRWTAEGKRACAPACMLSSAAMAWRRWTKRCVRWPVMMLCGNPLSKTRSATFNQRCLVSAAASTNTCTLRGPGIVDEYRIGLG